MRIENRVGIYQSIPPATITRANQIGLIEERGMMTNSMEKKDRSCSFEPIKRNMLSQTIDKNMIDRDMQTTITQYISSYCYDDITDRSNFR